MVRYTEVCWHVQSYCHLDLFSELRAKQLQQIPKVEHATHTNGLSIDTQGYVAKLHID